MMKNIDRLMITTMVICFGLCMSAFDSGIKLSREKVSDEISVLLPRDFRPMDELDLSQRYPSVRRPIAAYTNPDRLVDFSVNISASQWPDTNLDMAQKFFKAGIFNLFDNVEMISEGIHEVSGKKLIYFEFESRVKGDPRNQSTRDAVLNYTYIQYLVEPSRTMVFSFNCPRRMRADWQETAHKMMKGIRMKK
jgi:hypothetical protein